MHCCADELQAFGLLLPSGALLWHWVRYHLLSKSRRR